MFHMEQCVGSDTLFPKCGKRVNKLGINRKLYTVLYTIRLLVVVITETELEIGIRRAICDDFCCRDEALVGVYDSGVNRFGAGIYDAGFNIVPRGTMLNIIFACV
jgi:hypothetical protein